MPRSLGTVISSEFRTYLQERYPKVFNNPNKIAFLKHTLYLSDVPLEDEQSSRIIACDYVKEFILGLRKGAVFNVGGFLKDFQDNVDFPLNVNEHRFTKNLAREFKPELPDDLRNMLLKELETPKKDKINPVYFLDGTVWSDRRDSKNRKDMHTNHYKGVDTSGVILKYFSEQNPTIYNKYTENIDSLIEQLKIDKPNISPEKYESYLKHLTALGESLEPYYYQRAAHERVWASGYSLQNAPREFRRAILSNTVEVDLTSAHLSVVAYKWPIPGVISLLESGVNVWRHFHDELNLEFSPETKAGLKKGLYTILYGGGLDEIRKQMKLNGIGSDEAIDNFLSLPLILEIRAAAKVQGNLAKDNMFVELAGGKKLFARKKKDGVKALKPFALPSHAAISYERYIISIIFEVANKYPKVLRIISLESDGLTYEILDKSKGDMIFKRLQKTVAKTGVSLGIKISLEKKV